MAAAREPKAKRPPMRNAAVGAVFDEIADLLDIKGENMFRIRAYRNAARVVKGLPTEAAAMLKRGDKLDDLPGIGKDLAQKIADLVTTGTTKLLDELHKDLPPAIVKLLQVPGLGPKRVKMLYDKLHIETVPQLEKALAEGKLKKLPRFGEKLIQNIAQSLGGAVVPAGRTKHAAAARQAAALVAFLKKVRGVRQVTVAGSFRRGTETVGDLDIVATAFDAEQVIAKFCKYPGVARVLGQGPTRGTVVLRSGLQVDLRVVPEESYGAALVYFTGSKAHGIAIRRLAQKRKLKINEYGVFRGRKRIAGETEESVYAAIGLPFIAAELRENNGEVEAALAGKLAEFARTHARPRPPSG